MEPFPPSAFDDGDELDVEDAFGEHDIEYWVRSGGRLVPATPEQVAELRESAARRRLDRWQRLAVQAVSEGVPPDRRHASSFASLFVSRAATLALRVFKHPSQAAWIEASREPAERVDTSAAPTDAGRIR